MRNRPAVLGWLGVAVVTIIMQPWMNMVMRMILMIDDDDTGS
jgi:hypothetical protein